MAKTFRVLLVEDNEADAYLTRETLQSSKLLLEVTVVIDGSAALELLRSTLATAPDELPDLILLDLNLPGMSGREVLQALKQEDRLRRIPIVILTSSAAELDIVQSYDLGANCYVTKPVGLDAFQSIVSSVEGFWFTIVKLP